MSSLLQILSDNEGTSSSFFRKNSLRGIIFLSDEDDQSLEIPSSPGAGFKPFSNYACDQASLIGLNGAGAVTGANGICCNTGGNNCTHGAFGLSCPSKTVDGYTYTLSICADPSLLIPVSSVKQQLDNFFLTLDDSETTDPNYFIAAITPSSASAIQTLQTARSASDAVVGTHKMIEVDRGDRYIELGNLVGSDSLVLDISASDYSPILDAIGKKILQKKSTFTLSRAPTGKEDMLVTIRHKDGSETTVSSDLYVIQGKNLVFISEDFVLGFAASDNIVINYQPKTAN